ncbi:MAG: hypothetical protein IKE94_15660 [Aeriscardovia sp.]|nr:hypothetical protein [Aeriscardovia sp.]
MIQIDMGMPQNCAECPFLYDSDACYAVNKRNGRWLPLVINSASTEYKINQFPYKEKRVDWCPLMEVKHGKWIKADSQQYFRKHYPCFTCSECGYRKDSQKKWNYCPNCGAKMDADHE